MRLTGATRNPVPAIAGRERQPGISNYIRGNDPAKWRSGVPHYARVHYDQVYPGIDLVYYGNPQQLEYDLVVAPGADPGQIRLSFEGVDGMRIDGEGNLVLAVAGGEIVQKAPRIYQRVAGQELAVAGRYVLLEGGTIGGVARNGDVGMAGADGERSVGFVLAAYDPAQALVIDPVVVYSTYLGGGSYDRGGAIAVDAAGNAYVTGSTSSADFPTANARYPNLWGESDIFVTKLDPQGQGPVYSTYLGGSSYEGSYSVGIAVDAAGNAYLTGTTDSADFPMVNARYPNLRGQRDAFVTKLDPQGQGPVYSTYLGGSSYEDGTGIAVDNMGSAYVTGWTGSIDFPTVNARYPNLWGSGDAFVTKLDPHGQGPVYSTYLGGSGGYYEWGNAIAVDGAGHAYVTGMTSSADFPTVNARYSNLWGLHDAFVTKFDPQGQGPIYSTYLGGSGGFEQGHAIAVDGAGSAYVTGTTSSTDFPIVNARYPTRGDSVGGTFVTKFDSLGQGPVYSTFLSANSYPIVTPGALGGIAVDGTGNAYVTVNYYSELNGSVTKLDPQGQGPVYSIFLGGSSYDNLNAITVDGVGNAYVTGWTSSSDFPTVNARYPHLWGSSDAFVTKISDSGLPRDGAHVDLELLDAKDFRNGATISSTPAVLANRKGGHSMKGVATDGAAQLILRARTNRPGTVTFSIAGADGATGKPAEDGQLLSRYGNPAGDTIAVVAEAIPGTPGEYYAFARYQAPETFPRASVPADRSAAQRSLRLRLDFQPSDGTPPPAQPLDRWLTLKRPPVVLIHGLNSNRETWKTFKEKLQARIPGLWIDAEVGDYRYTSYSYNL
jgi:hypothetical protein